MKDTLIKLFGINAMALARNLEGISHEDSVVNPQPGGNSLNWNVGHIVHSRNGLIGMIGCEPIWAEGHGAGYGRGEALEDPSRAQPLDTLIADFDKTEPILMEGIAALSDEQFAKALPSGFPGGFDTVGEGIAFLHFHEAYHVGQVGLLRRLAGKAGAIA